MIRFGIGQIACMIPPHTEAVADVARATGHDEAYVKRLHDNGLRRIPIADSESVGGMISEVISQLRQREPDLNKSISGVLLAHSLASTVSDGYPLLEESLAPFGIAQVPKIAVSGQPCSIIHFGIQLAGCWLASLSPDASILILGVDRADSLEERIFFGSAMGDAAVALLATRQFSCNEVLASISQTYVVACAGEESPPDDIVRFRAENPLRIRSAILQCLKEANISLDELAYIVPHTPYHLIWDTVSELLRFPRERILTDYLAETGHMNSNDVIVHFERAIREGRIKSGEIAMMVSPGFGGTRGCTAIRV
jgi:3-oxoacyl-[acyl-carrier-protein] synthase-3